MNEPANEMCMVCKEELQPGADGVVAVKNLWWHKECLSYIPADQHFDRVRQRDGHAVKDRLGTEIDMSVLLGRGNGYYRRGGDNEGGG